MRMRVENFVHYAVYCCNSFDDILFTVYSFYKCIVEVISALF